MIRVPCKWMWRSWFLASFADHLSDIKSARTAVSMLNCAQKSLPKWIKALNYFNNKYISCLLVPVVVRSGAKDLAAGYWDHGFESCFGTSRHWLSWMIFLKKRHYAHLRILLGYLPDPAIDKLRFADTLNLRGRKFAALNTAFMLSR